MTYHYRCGDADPLDSGATFVILSKAKGWYIVQKDPDGLGNIVPDQSRSGWVPAGELMLPRLLYQALKRGIGPERK